MSANFAGLFSLMWPVCVALLLLLLLLLLTLRLLLHALLPLHKKVKVYPFLITKNHIIVCVDNRIPANKVAISHLGHNTCLNYGVN